MKRSELKRGTSQLKRSAMPPREHFINKKSTKTAKRDRLYAKLREPFLAAHPECQVKWDAGCSGLSSLVHHRMGRVGAAMLDQATWVASCDHCHRGLHDAPELARELGWMDWRYQ